MKLTNHVVVAVLSISAFVASAHGQSAPNVYYEANPLQQPIRTQVGCDLPSCGCEGPICGCEAPCAAEPACGCGEPICGCEAPCAAEPACGCGEPACGCAEPGYEVVQPDCGCPIAPECGCELAPVYEPACGCADPCAGACGGCDSGCESNKGWLGLGRLGAGRLGLGRLGLGRLGAGWLGAGRLGAGRMGKVLDHCDHGEQWSLFGSVGPWSAGGWTQFGYFDKSLPLFNSRDDNLQLQQQWLYAEKAIDTTDGFDIGGRVDYIYGTDGPDTQAFGIDNNHWDNGWDHGGDYGNALPQLYLEAGYGDLSVKVGHFYTIIGYEVVQAPDNFLYSHAYTMYNSEPFTHTGALATYTASEDVTVYGGYVLGWDSGFEDNGDAFLGGISLTLTEKLSVTYATIGGRFFETMSGGERGYMQSIVATYAMSDKLTYVNQTDYLSTEDAAGNGVRETFDLNQYLLYEYNDCWSFGGRLEWYNNEGVFTDFGQTANIYALTLGTNYKPHANVIIRPEVRWDWVFNTTAIADAGNSVLENNDQDQTTVGIDTIFLF